MGIAEINPDRRSKVEQKLGELLMALLKHFQWVKVAETRSVFSTQTITLLVTKMQNNKSVTQTHTCTEQELFDMSDARVVADYMAARMQIEWTKLYGSAKK